MGIPPSSALCAPCTPPLESVNTWQEAHLAVTEERVLKAGDISVLALSPPLPEPQTPAQGRHLSFPRD